jgi:hypothetical protein
MTSLGEILPVGQLRAPFASSWLTCDFCGQCYPQKELSRDAEGKLACKACWFRADVLKAAEPIREGARKARFVSTVQAEELARRNGLPIEEAHTELQEMGFRAEEHARHHFWVRMEAST